MKSEQLATIQDRLAEGVTPEQIASEFGIHYTTLLRRINSAGYQIERESTYRLVAIEPVQLPTSAGSEATR